MNKSITLQILLELVWWVVTALIVVAVQYPIHQAIQVWPFHTWNIVFIVVLITLTRYIFLLKHTFIAHLQVLKVALMILMFPAMFILIGGVNGFMTYIEELTWDPLTGHLPLSQKREIEQYIWYEMLFFGVGSIVALGAFSIRLMMSVWRKRNLGTV